MPFVTHGIQSALELLPDTIGKQITYLPVLKKRPAKLTTIFSQPTDSLLKTMMYRSDNFYAEQSLLMVSQEKLGEMNDRKIIDTLLKTDLSDLPQKPRWVDGTGLSRYNLFTPNDFVVLLQKMQREIATGSAFVLQCDLLFLIQYSEGMQQNLLRVYPLQNNSW